MEMKISEEVLHLTKVLKTLEDCCYDVSSANYHWIDYDIENELSKVMDRIVDLRNRLLGKSFVKTIENMEELH